MDIPLDEVIYFDAISSGSTGVAADADSTPAFAVYEEATDTDIGVGGNMTKRTSLTGNYRGTFTASAANGFEVGKWYSVIGSATIGAIACKGVLRSFRIVLAESITGAPKVDEHALKGDAQSATDLKDFADTGYDPSPHKVAGVVLADTLTTYTGNTPQTGDCYPKVDTEVATLVTGVADIQARIPAALGANGNLKADLRDVIGVAVTATGGRQEVNATHFAGTAYASAVPANFAALGINASGHVSRVTLVDTTTTNTDMTTAAGIRTAVGLGSANLDSQLDALPTAAEIADAVYDEATAGHTTSGTFGEQLKTDIDSILAATGSSGVVLSTATCQKIAHVIARATIANIEDSVDGDALDKNSLYGFLMGVFNSAMSGTTWTIKKRDNSTLGTRTVASDSGADPTTGVSSTFS